MSFQKRKPYRNKKITQSARGEACAVMLPIVCTGGGETTVYAHSPYAEDGKGMGVKSGDLFGCYACRGCHDELDGRTHILSSMDRAARRDIFHRAMKRTQRKLLDKGIIG